MEALGQQDTDKLFTVSDFGHSLTSNGRGRLIPTTSCDEYFAELALWLGVSPTNLPLVLPNIGNFYSPSPTAGPLGFLG